jgi:hypothetical protein
VGLGVLPGLDIQEVDLGANRSGATMNLFDQASITRKDITKGLGKSWQRHVGEIDRRACARAQKRDRQV